MMEKTKLPEKVTLFFSKYKILFGFFIPLIILGVLMWITKDFMISKTIVLDCLGFIGFIIAIFVLENTEKNKKIVDNFLNEIWNQELTIIENDLKVLGGSICSSNSSFEQVKKNETMYSNEILKFNLALKKYIEKYKYLNDFKEVQNFHRYMEGYNIAALLRSKWVYDSYIRILEPLYILIDSKISVNSKQRLKEMGDYK